MRLPSFLQGIPGAAWIVAIPAAAFLVTIGVTLGTSSNDEDTVAVLPTVNLSAAHLDVPATATPRPSPTATPIPEPTAIPDRDDCDEIRGTDYRSGSEREWYLANCLGGGGGSGSGGSSSAPAAVTGPQTTGGGEYALGDRLVIPAAGVDAPVSGVAVPTNGAMPDPVGYFNAVWYDFSAFSGLGGTPGNGNAVLAGHVDSARYGLAVFYYVRNLGPGDTIQYIKANGDVLNYVVTSSVSYPTHGVDWNHVAASGTADLTLITCTGTFGGGGYDQRHVVHARLQ